MAIKTLKGLNKFFNNKLKKTDYYVIVGKDKKGKYFSAYVYSLEDCGWIQDAIGEVRLYQHKYDDIGDCNIGLFNAELDAFHVYENFIPLPCYNLEIYPYMNEKSMQKACKRLVELGMYRFIK